MNERKKATKAIILARVSSKEQEDGYSIDAQKYRLQEYCVRKGLEILKVFEFSESFTTGNIESNNRADNNFSETLITMLKLASNASETFKGSTTEEKRKLINLVFSNLELKGHKLVYALRPPFNAFIKRIETDQWCTREESNP